MLFFSVFVKRKPNLLAAFRQELIASVKLCVGQPVPKPANLVELGEQIRVSAYKSRKSQPYNFF